MKAKTFKLKRKKTQATPTQISLSPDAFAFIFEGRVLFSSSFFMKTAKLIANILFA